VIERYVRAESTEQLLELLERPGATILCGGTDLVVRMRKGLVDPPLLVDVSRLALLRGIREEDGQIVLGAAATEAELLRSDVVRKRLPLLAAVLEQLGSVQIRSRGTLGGNLVNASPAADSAVPLLLYEAEMVLASREGYRRMPLEEFLVGPGKTQLRAGEFVQEIRIQPVDGEPIVRFHKIGRRRALTIAIASVGMLAGVEAGKVSWLRLAAGSVAPRVLRLRAVEQAVAGGAVDASLAAHAGELARAAVSPIDDVRGSADYRRAVVGDLVSTFIADLGSRG